MNIKMIMHLFSAFVLMCAVAAQCPAPNDINLTFGAQQLIRCHTVICFDQTPRLLWFGYYFQSRITASSTDRMGQMFLETLENSKCADLSTIPDDNPDLTSRSKSKPLLQVSLAVSECEPCPPTVHFLGRFYGSCYVIKPQQVRYVTCGGRCKQPCMCSRSYCQGTHYTRVWFLSYCTGNVGGFQFGLNFRFLWLPQDCACRNY